MRLRNSFWALLGQPATEAPEAVVERVRGAMLSALVEHLGPEGQELKQQVHFAHDIESLWYLRPEIMNAMAARRGEARARVCMTGLTALFKDHHPGAASSRFGAL
ncbi:hypothetical protein [Curvibacter sp. PAE-UM]|uniref:hypothetical protein n=1 Tax=Curvibacter sp. PAE-UM TaxID=1714344 RepID=UPI00070B674D|nr:hypothetical protein [Curvibacter sp. PAE-UM]KRI00326.1 hypothetical protein AO057_14250 [Curvibacter sp. PAE-UM]